MPKRADEMIFATQCPCQDCYNKKIIIWHHYGCPFNIPLYISTKGVIRCENCGMVELFFNCKYNCGCHEGESFSAKFRSPSSHFKKISEILGELEDIKVFTVDFICILHAALRQQFRNKYKNNNY